MILDDITLESLCGYDWHIITDSFEAICKLLVDSLSFERIVSLCAVFISYVIYTGQKKVNELQMFETTLFNMMNLQIAIINNLTYKGEQPTSSPIEGNFKILEKKIHGIDVFKFFWEKCWFLKRFTHDENKNILKINISWKYSKEGMQNALVSYGSSIYKDCGHQLNCLKPYFLHLYEMINFVDSRNFLSKTQKKEYVDQIRSTLSPYELIWIFYDCLFGDSNKTLKSLVEKYTLLRYISKESLSVTRDNFEDADKYLNDFDYYKTKNKKCKLKFYESAFIEISNKL